MIFLSSASFRKHALELGMGDIMVSSTTWLLLTYAGNEPERENRFEIGQLIRWEITNPSQANGMGNISTFKVLKKQHFLVIEQAGRTQ